MADNIYGSSNFANANLGDAAWRASLPPWLQAQIRQVADYSGSGGDAGTTQTGTKWVAGDVGGFGSGDQDYGGYLRDEQGNPVAVLGNWDGTGVQNDQFLKDPSKVRIDPVLGRVVDPKYIRSTPTGGINWTMLAIALGAGALGTAAGLGAEGAAAGEGAAGSMTGAAGNESAGLLGADGTMGGTTGGGLGAGTAGYDASGGGLLNSGLSGGEGGSGGLLGGSGGTLDPITLQSVPEVNAGGMATYNGSPWYQSLLDNPMGTARTVAGLYSMGSSLANRNQHVTAGHPQYAGGGVAQGVPTLNIGGGNGGGQSGFQQNPFLMRQMFNVPFMSGATGLLS